MYTDILTSFPACKNRIDVIFIQYYKSIPEKERLKNSKTVQMQKYGTSMYFSIFHSVLSNQFFSESQKNHLGGRNIFFSKRPRMSVQVKCQIGPVRYVRKLTPENYSFGPGQIYGEKKHFSGTTVIGPFLLRHLPVTNLKSQKHYI